MVYKSKKKAGKNKSRDLTDGRLGQNGYSIIHHVSMKYYFLLSFKID